MYKNFLVALAIVAVTGAGLYGTSVSALTADDVQAQIQKLMAQITELTAQITRLRAQVHTSLPNANASPVAFQHRICNILNRNLVRGAEGDDVRGLQEYLYENKFLAVAPTGYFGQMTQEAVRKWQANEGVSAVGAFGPMSRERIKIWCGGGGFVNKERFSVSPTRGDAPLTVTFNTWLSGFRMPIVTYGIDFGDGTSEGAANCPAPADACTGPGQNTHTYSQNGTYTATLHKYTANCAKVVNCTTSNQDEILGKVQIHVGPVACTKEYKPVCGARPIVCITTPCNPIPTTYGNRCEMNADGASFLYEGQCRSDYKNPADDPQCKSWTDGYTCGSRCHRDYAGGPPICMQLMCAVQQYGMPEQAVPRCLAYFNNSGNKPPVISSFSGPTTLALNTTGTWTIKASDPENGQLTYQVWWGDEHIYSPANASTVSAREFIQSTTFTHSYANAGTYTVSIVVRDSAGQEAKTSTTVRVGSETTACTQEAMQCPNGQWVGRTGPNCQFVCN